MDFPLLLPIFAILNLVVVATHGGALSPELYWKSVLPTTPMPKAITNILHPDWREEKSTYVGVGKGGVNVQAGKGKPGATAVNVGHGGVHVNTGKGTNVNVGGKGGVSVHAPGTLSITFILFLSAAASSSIAFGIKGEEKYCATSLESMVDFSTSKLGKNVDLVSTEISKETKLQSYKVAAGVKKINHGNKAVVCHKQNYPYAVFYCHKTETIMAFKVPLEGADGSRVKAAAVCHTDTSGWNPKHLAFQVLKVKPGTPVCHFLPEDHVVWVSK
ncbi:BURP domain protein RD22 [Arachis duranensis]|uniref:BURP domain protein RD22 n=1 Tax=Arachis duranensis TaxID=130453 RepID=A0A9C6WMR1_ARADU|nr:BURP domain protein RD22 [Arachis duranensis]